MNRFDDNWQRQRGLDEYDDGEGQPPAPNVTRIRALDHPTKPEKTAGWVGTCHARECRVYVTIRTRGSRDRPKHYHWKHGGYAISEKLFGPLQMMNVELVYLVERDTGDVFEYSLRQFVQAETRLTYNADDPQRLVKNHERRRKWEGLGGGVWYGQGAGP